MEPISEDDFVELVEQALDELPEEMLAHLDNVALVVEDQHPEEPDLLGLYEGIPLVERLDDYFSGALPDRIAIYRLPLCYHAEDAEHLREEIAITVVHEIAHHHGIDDDHLHELGWS